MHMNTDFDVFAPFYDRDVQYNEDLSLYLNFAHRTGDPILEVGCGTGRVLIPLAQAGYHVTGIDISKAMLTRAQAKARQHGIQHRVSLIQTDARYLALAQQFTLIIYAANSFMHHITLEEQRRVLQRLREHLRPGGLLIIDLFNPDINQLSRANGELTLVKMWQDEEGRRVLKFQSVVASPTHQTLDVTYVYDRVFADGHVERTVAPFRLRYLWPNEIRLLIESTGLRLKALYGSYELEPVDDGAPRLIVVARRE